MPRAALAAWPPDRVGASIVDDPGDPASARQLFQLLNGDRAQAGLPPLAWDDGLAAAALKHAQLMVDRNQLSHQFPSELPLQRRVTAVPLDLSGENVGIDMSIPDANTGLMHSPPHRANILSPEFNAVGIGVVWKGDQAWVAQDFARRIELVSGESAAEKVEGAFARARAQAGLPHLPRIRDGRLSVLACDMGYHNQLETGKALKSTYALMAMAYTTSRPEELSQTAIQAAYQRSARSYGLGVCFQRSFSYPSGVYWVLLMLYAR
jgi:hypothetical protein